MTYASIYIAVPLTKVVWVEERAETVTRYDEKTGKPYQKEVTQNRLIVAGKDITDELQEDIDKYGFENVVYSSEWLEEKMPAGLMYIQGSECNHPNDGLAGIGVINADGDSDAIVGDEKEVAASFEKMRKLLRGCGLDHLEPKMHMRVSY